jgi:hypothetical protein
MVRRRRIQRRLLPGLAGKALCGDTRRYIMDPSVTWLRAEHRGVTGGKIQQAGFYVMPFCHPMCCRPDGPFRTKSAALAWSRSLLWRHASQPLIGMR